MKTMNRFGFRVGPHTLALFHGLRWNTPAAFIARILCGLASLGVARWLGPAGYGQANLALASTFWIQIPLFIGIPTAVMHYVPQAKGNERDQYAASGIFLLAIAGAATFLIAYAALPFWADLQGITPAVFQLAMVWCLGFAFYVVATSLLSAYELFAERARYEIVFALLFASSIAAAKLLHFLHPVSYLWAYTLAYGLTGGIALWKVWPKSFFTSINRRSVNMLLGYGMLALLLNIVHALFNAPARLIINKHLALTDVGILSAYQAGSIQMAFFFIGIISRVFFPIASRTPDRVELFRKVNRFMWISCIPLVLMYIAVLVLSIVALGRNYPLRVLDLIIFSIAATLTTYFNLFSWLLASEGKRGVVIFALTGLLAGGINAWGALYFIPIRGVTGAAIAQALACLTGVILCSLPPVIRLSQRVSAKT